MGTTYLITFQRQNKKKTALVEMPNMMKLLAWIANTAPECEFITIMPVKEEE